MSAGLQISDDEARTLVVDTLELMTREEFEHAQSVAHRCHLPIEKALTESSGMPTRFFLEQVAQAWQTPFVDLKPGDVDITALRRVPEPVSRACRAVAFAVADGTLDVAMANPRDRRAVRQLEQLTRLRVRAHLAPVDGIHRAQLLYRGHLRELLKSVARGAGEELPLDGTAEATDLLDRLLEYAAVAGASDVHIEPYEHELLVRCRVDGALLEVLRAPTALAGPLAARTKALAGMRLDDRRSPQDGRFGRDLGDVRIDLRVSSLPTYWGEKLVLRVIAQERGIIDLQDLGLRADDYAAVTEAAERPFGMVLITGPTGSGKTTTLYSLLVRLVGERRSLVNISTIEDPIEFPLERVSQVAVNPAAGIDFASGLRSLLRQDPDVIMVGEIRDIETARMGVRAALVGRLLLSTLHTNDAPTAVPRLLDMGIEPYLLASTLSMVVAQRLVRRVCRACRQSVVLDAAALAAYDLDAHALERLGVAADGRVRVFTGAGCARCDHTGYRGRVALFEILRVTDRIRRLIGDRADVQALRMAMDESGASSMLDDGLAKVTLGETTLEEVLATVDADRGERMTS